MILLNIKPEYLSETDFEIDFNIFFIGEDNHRELLVSKSFITQEVLESASDKKLKIWYKDLVEFSDCFGYYEEIYMDHKVQIDLYESDKKAKEEYGLIEDEVRKPIELIENNTSNIVFKTFQLWTELELKSFGHNHSKRLVSYKQTLIDLMSQEHHISYGIALCFQYSKKIGVKDKDDLVKISFAYMLRELGLSQIPRNLIITSDESNELYRKYPFYTLFVLEKLSIPLDVFTKRLIEEHREDINGTGFPNQKPASSVNEYSFILGVVGKVMSEYSDNKNLIRSVSNTIKNEEGIFPPRFLEALEFLKP